MKKAKKINEIWNYDTCAYDKEEMKQEYEEIYGETPDEEELDRFIEDTNDMFLDDERSNVEFYEKQYGQKTYIILADLGLWDGRAEGGKIIKGLWNAISKCFEDYNHIYEYRRRLCVDAIHHDGTNHFQIKELTPRGLEYIEKNPYMPDRELHQHLFRDSHYSNEVKLFKTIYGWKGGDN